MVLPDDVGQLPAIETSGHQRAGLSMEHRHVRHTVTIHAPALGLGH